MKLRAARASDLDAIRSLYLEAFPEEERELVAELAARLLSEPSTPPTISLVAELDSDIVGHVAFSPVSCTSDPEFRGSILAPLAVSPSQQKRGIGGRLVDMGKEEVMKSGADVIFVYGDPAYYGRFGFLPDALTTYRPAYELQYPFGWQFLPFGERTVESPPVEIECVDALSDPRLW